MKVRIFLSPFDAPISEVFLEEPMRIIDMIPDDGTREVFSDGGVVRTNGTVVPNAWWPYVTVKPIEGYVDFIYVPRGKKTLLVLAAVALVAVTGFVGAGGVAALFGLGATSTFAAGGLGASLLAAGIGVAGSLALTALSAPPKATNGTEDKTLSQAGISGNLVTPLEALPTVYGVIGTSPPMLAPPYTVWDGDDVVAYGVVGVEGRCAIDDIKINGIPIDDFAYAEYETREGRPGDGTARTMFTQTVVEERDGTVLSNFKTELALNSNDLLTNQTDPDSVSPQWHPFRTAGSFDKVTLRFMFPSGIVYTSTGAEAFVPIRMRMRKIGSSTWRNLPTFHIYDKDKGAGPMRAEISLERIRQPAGRHFCCAYGEYPIFDICHRTGHGQSFDFSSDSYFAGHAQASARNGETADYAIPVMTNYTTSGYTMSASSEFTTGYRAWYVNDASGTTYWRPLANSLPAWVQWQLPSAKTFRSYMIISTDSSGFDAVSYSPTIWMPQGSNDGTTWTDLDDVDVDVSHDPKRMGHYQIGNPGSYLYYRILFKQNNGGASQDLRASYINWYEFDAPGLAYGQGDGGALTATNGGVAFYGPYDATYQNARCTYVSLNKRGARVFLDPDQWEEGEYEIQVRRGVSAYYAYYNSMTVSGVDPPYRYNGSWVNSDYFDYRLTSGQYKIYVGQRLYRSDMNVEAFQTISNESPFDDEGIALVAVAVPNANISSLYARFSKYAREFNGTIWSEDYTQTANPAAHYRDLLLGAGNAQPVPGECIDEAGLAEWYQNCETNGYEVNAILQGSRVGDAKQMIATCGYATPSDGELYGVIEDKDTSSLPVMYMITPQNSSDEGNVNEIPDLPHAIRAEYADADQTYAIEHTIVYREGYSAGNATLFETINYAGFTDTAKVEARAAFDLNQKYLRQAIYTRRCGRSAIGIRRGDVVGLVDPTIDGERSFGWISSIQTSGSGPSTQVTGITIDNKAQWSVSTSLEEVDDLEGIGDLTDITNEMAVAVRIPGSEILVKKVTDTSDSTSCTFETPFTLAGSGLEVGLQVVTGKYATITRRCRVLYIIPDGFEERILVLVDEAPELFA